MEKRCMIIFVFMFAARSHTHCVSVCIAVYYTGHHTFIVHASDFRWQNCVPNKIKAFLIQIEREPLLNESTDKGTLIRLCKHHFESYCK